jgi:hypothetical protein
MRRTTEAAADQQVTPEPDSLYTPAPQYSGRACCCPVRPAVIAVLPPSASRPSETDLLFCGHHYRQSLPGLAAEGATILDFSGYPLTAGAWPDPG